jgi:hypothetical protein
MFVAHFLDGPLGGRTRQASGERVPDRYSVLLNRGTADRPDVVRVDYERVGGYGRTGLYKVANQSSTHRSQTKTPPLWLYE